MRIQNKTSGRASSMAGGVAWGVLEALLLAACLGGLLAYLIAKELVPQERLGYGVMVILFLAGAVSDRASYRRIRHRGGMVLLLSVVSLLAVLLSLTALFFGGQYDGVLPTALLIAGGGGSAFLLSGRKERTKHKGGSRAFR